MSTEYLALRLTAFVFAAASVGCASPGRRQLEESTTEFVQRIELALADSRDETTFAPESGTLVDETPFRDVVETIDERITLIVHPLGGASSDESARASASRSAHRHVDASAAFADLYGAPGDFDDAATIELDPRTAGARDFRDFLPPDGMTSSNSWTIDPSNVRRFLSPRGSATEPFGPTPIDKLVVPQCVLFAAPASLWSHVAGRFELHRAAWLDRGDLAAIALEFELTGRSDLSSESKRALELGLATLPFTHDLSVDQRVESRLRGTGTLLWNLRSNRLVSISVRTAVELVEAGDVRFDFPDASDGGSSVSARAARTWRGSIETRVTSR